MSNLKFKRYDRFSQLNPKDYGRPPMSCLRPNNCNSTGNGVIEQYDRKTWQGNRPYIYTYTPNDERNCKEGFEAAALLSLLPDEEEYYKPMGAGNTCQWNSQCQTGRCEIIHGKDGICKPNLLTSGGVLPSCKTTPEGKPRIKLKGSLFQSCEDKSFFQGISGEAVNEKKREAEEWAATHYVSDWFGKGGQLCDGGFTQPKCQKPHDPIFCAEHPMEYHAKTGSECKN